MPPDALVILDDGDENLVEDVGARLPEAVVRLAPARHQPDLPGEADVGWREADGDDVVLGNIVNIISRLRSSWGCVRF